MTKPAPDLYLHIAESHGVAPSICAVIEDSPPVPSPPAAPGSDAWALPKIRVA